MTLLENQVHGATILVSLHLPSIAGQSLLGGKNKTHPQGNSLTQLLPWKRNRHYSQLWRILVGSSKATEKAANPQKTLLSSCGDSGRPEGWTQDGPEQQMRLWANAPNRRQAEAAISHPVHLRAHRNSSVKLRHTQNALL